MILVTGAAGALGGALARHLARSGHKVGLLDTVHGASRLEALVGELGASAHGRALDVEDTSALRKALDSIEEEAGEAFSHAALVAGGWKGGAPIHETADDSVYQAMMQSNVDTVYMALRALLPRMVANKSGSIVVVGSRNVARPWTGARAAAYTAAKSAAVALALATAAEVLAHGVRVNAVLISTMDTPANRQSMPDADPGKWVTTESAAEVIAFLLSDAAREISGAEIPVYGRA